MFFSLQHHDFWHWSNSFSSHDNQFREYLDGLSTLQRHGIDSLLHWHDVDLFDLINFIDLMDFFDLSDFIDVMDFSDLMDFIDSMDSIDLMDGPGPPGNCGPPGRE